MSIQEVPRHGITSKKGNILNVYIYSLKFHAVSEEVPPSWKINFIFLTLSCIPFKFESVSIQWKFTESHRLSLIFQSIVHYE